MGVIRKIKNLIVFWRNQENYQYLIDLERRCKRNNFAPFDLRVKTNNGYNSFQWSSYTIKIAEDWLKVKSENQNKDSN